MLGDQAGEERAVDPPRDVVPRGDRQEGAGVVVEADGVVEARGLGRLLAEAAHAFGAVVEPPGRAELAGRVVAGQRRQLARVGGLVEREEDDREAAARCRSGRAAACSARTYSVARRDVGALVAAEAVKRRGCGCGTSRDGSASPCPSSRLIARHLGQHLAAEQFGVARAPSPPTILRTAPRPRPAAGRRWRRSGGRGRWRSRRRRGSRRGASVRGEVAAPARDVLAGRSRRSARSGGEVLDARDRPPRRGDRSVITRPFQPECADRLMMLERCRAAPRWWPAPRC